MCLKESQCSKQLPSDALHFMFNVYVMLNVGVSNTIVIIETLKNTIIGHVHLLVIHFPKQLSLSSMNGRPNRPRRGRGRAQHGWRPQEEEGEPHAGRSDKSQESQGWGHQQKRRPQGDEPWDRPKEEHWRVQKDFNRQQQNWRQRPEHDRDMTQNWRQRSDYQRQQQDEVQKPKQDRQKQGWTQQPEQEEVHRANADDVNPQGTCMTMCPRRELQDREAQCRLHRFEILAGTENERKPKADPARVVKEYSRPAAGKDATRPSDLRPPAVLLKTVCYLIDEIAASPTLQPWTEVRV